MFYLAGAVFVAATGIAFGAPLWVLMIASGILGPIIIGAALAAEWSAGAVFYAMAVPVLAAGLAVLVLDRRYGRLIDGTDRGASAHTADRMYGRR